MSSIPAPPPPPPPSSSGGVSALTNAVISTALLTFTGAALAFVTSSSSSSSSSHPSSSGPVAALGAFVATLALPAAVLVSLAQADFHLTNVAFIVSALIAKSICALASAAVASMASKPSQRSAWAGAAVLLATQSNDIAVGYPIVDALFGMKRPAFATQLFLVAPVQLILFTSAGVALLNQGRGGTLGDTIRLTARMPLVVASILGLALNALQGGITWKPLKMTLETLANAYPATALVSLGARLATIRHTNHHSATSAGNMSGGLAVAGVLGCKHLLAPAAAAVTAYALSKGDRDSGTLAFIYGALPVAPSVPVLASELLGDTITSRRIASISAVAVVASLFVSAPLLLCSGLIFSEDNHGEEASSSYFEILGTAAVPAYLSSAVGGSLLLVAMIRRGWLGTCGAVRAACCTLVMVKLACLASALGFMVAQSYGALGSAGYWREIAFAPWCISVLANKGYLCVLATRMWRHQEDERPPTQRHFNYVHLVIATISSIASAAMRIIHGPSSRLDPSSNNSATWWLLYGPTQVLVMDTASAFAIAFCSWCIIKTMSSSVTQDEDLSAPLLLADETQEDVDDAAANLQQQHDMYGDDVDNEHFPDVQTSSPAEDALLHSRLLLMVGYDVATELLGVAMDVLWALGASFSNLLLVFSVLFAIVENGALCVDAVLLFPVFGLPAPLRHVMSRARSLARRFIMTEDSSIS
ncbi:calcium-transporting ATPase [Pseudoscourfieldia marina]